jgi:hypothetical protein
MPLLLIMVINPHSLRAIVDGGVGAGPARAYAVRSFLSVASRCAMILPRYSLTASFRSRCSGGLASSREGLRELPHVRLVRLPRVADFALWATACETALWPAGTFACAYEAIARPRSWMPSTPTRWPTACARSWPNAVPGPEAPPICYVPGQILPVKAF